MCVSLLDRVHSPDSHGSAGLVSRLISVKSLSSNAHNVRQPTPSEGRQRWHYDTPSSPHQPPDPFTISDDYGRCWSMGTAAATARAAVPSRDYGPDRAAGGLRRSTLWKADDTTKRPSASWPTRQSDARVSEPRFAMTDEALARLFFVRLLVFVFLCGN